MYQKVKKKNKKKRKMSRSVAQRSQSREWLPVGTCANVDSDATANLVYFGGPQTGRSFLEIVNEIMNDLNDNGKTDKRYSVKHLRKVSADDLYRSMSAAIADKNTKDEKCDALEPLFDWQKNFGKKYKFTNCTTLIRAVFEYEDESPFSEQGFEFNTIMDMAMQKEKNRSLDEIPTLAAMQRISNAVDAVFFILEPVHDKDTDTHRFTCSVVRGEKLNLPWWFMMGQHQHIVLLYKSGDPSHSGKCFHIAGIKSINGSVESVFRNGNAPNVLRAFTDDLDDETCDHVMTA
jgi:hypothetical protein